MATIATTVPAIEAPQLTGEEEALRIQTQFVSLKPWLTTYSHCQPHPTMIREFDYRLRWTLETNTNYATAKAEVWSTRNSEWHEVWTHRGKVVSTYDRDPDVKVRSWNAILDALAVRVSTVLLPVSDF